MRNVVEAVDLRVSSKKDIVGRLIIRCCLCKGKGTRYGMIVKPYILMVA